MTVTAPRANATYALNQSVPANFACQDGGSGLASCQGTVAPGAAIDTSSPGVQSFSVTGTDSVGNDAVVNVSYTVTGPGTFSFGGTTPVDAIEQTVTAGGSSLTYDAAAVWRRPTRDA